MTYHSTKKHRVIARLFSSARNTRDKLPSLGELCYEAHNSPLKFDLCSIVYLINTLISVSSNSVQFQSPPNGTILKGYCLAAATHVAKVDNAIINHINITISFHIGIMKPT